MPEKQESIEALRQTLLATLPEIFTRKTAAKETGSVISAGTLANLDSAGEGPPDKIQVNRKTAYLREPFVTWFIARVSTGKAAASASSKEKGAQ